MHQAPQSECPIIALHEHVHRVSVASSYLRERRLQVDLSGTDLTALVRFSVLADVPPSERAALLLAAGKVPAAQRAAGALVGLAIGDALGAPFEFLPAINNPGASGCWIDATTLQAFGTEKASPVTQGKCLKEGQWTDDTSMALCLADSLLTGKYCGSDVRVRFWNWWHRGYNNGFHRDTTRASYRSVGLGMNIGKALDAIKDSEPPHRYEVMSEDAGNGSLMRLAPVPIAFASDLKLAMTVSAESSRTTHPGPVAASACRFLGHLIWHALAHPDQQTAQQFLDFHVREYLAHHGDSIHVDLQRMLLSEEPEGSKERCWNWKSSLLNIEAALEARTRDGTYNGYPVSREYFGSYCLDGLAVAMHSMYHSRTFVDAVVRCVNFLGDADSTAAICGQLAGTFYGYGGIDQRLIERLSRWDDGEIACRGILLWALGAEAPPIDEPQEVEHMPCAVTSPQQQQLVEMGFTAAQAQMALEEAGGDVQTAALILLSR